LCLLQRALDKPDEVAERQRQRAEAEMRDFEQRTGRAVDSTAEGAYRGSANEAAAVAVGFAHVPAALDTAASPSISVKEPPPSPPSPPLPSPPLPSLSLPPSASSLGRKSSPAGTSAPETATAFAPKSKSRRGGGAARKQRGAPPADLEAKGQNRDLVHVRASAAGTAAEVAGPAGAVDKDAAGRPATDDRVGASAGSSPGTGWGGRWEAAGDLEATEAAAALRVLEERAALVAAKKRALDLEASAIAHDKARLEAVARAAAAAAAKRRTEVEAKAVAAAAKQQADAEAKAVAAATKQQADAEAKAVAAAAKQQADVEAKAVAAAAKQQADVEAKAVAATALAAVVEAERGEAADRLTEAAAEQRRRLEHAERLQLESEVRRQHRAAAEAVEAIGWRRHDADDKNADETRGQREVRNRHPSGGGGFDGHVERSDPGSAKAKVPENGRTGAARAAAEAKAAAVAKAERAKSEARAAAAAAAAAKQAAAKKKAASDAVLKAEADALDAALAEVATMTKATMTPPPPSMRAPSKRGTAAPRPAALPPGLASVDTGGLSKVGSAFAAPAVLVPSTPAAQSASPFLSKATEHAAASGSPKAVAASRKATAASTPTSTTALDSSLEPTAAASTGTPLKVASSPTGEKLTGANSKAQSPSPSTPTAAKPMADAPSPPPLTTGRGGREACDQVVPQLRNAVPTIEVFSTSAKRTADAAPKLNRSLPKRSADTIADDLSGQHSATSKSTHGVEEAIALLVKRADGRSEFVFKDSSSSSDIIRFVLK
jgi:hypothetical protein